MVRFLAAMIPLVLFAMTNGCLATANILSPEPQYYGGTLQDFGVCAQCFGEGVGVSEPAPCLGEPLNAGGRLVVFTLCLLDAPLSFVADTVTLPYVMLARTGSNPAPSTLDGFFTTSP
jgi:uncharacterized protein YceK